MSSSTQTKIVFFTGNFITGGVSNRETEFPAKNAAVGSRSNYRLRRARKQRNYSPEI
jgi:hypothetical protein